MILDAIINLLLDVWDGIVGMLPTGHLSLPPASGISTVLAQVDSLVPILGPLSIALVILAAVGVFIAVRLLLVVVNIVWP